MTQITVTQWLALLDSIKADVAARWPSVKVNLGVASLAAEFGRWRITVHVEKGGRPFAIIDGVDWPSMFEDVHFFIHGRVELLTILAPTDAEVALLRDREPKPITAEEFEAIVRGLKRPGSEPV